MNHPGHADPDQERYARVLAWCTGVSFAALIALFGTYLTGVFAPFLSHEQLPELWRLPAAEMLRATGQHGGWDWAHRIDRIDVATLGGIALLALCPVLPLMAVMPIYWRMNRRLLFAICALEVAVIVLAASGVVGSGR